METLISDKLNLIFIPTQQTNSDLVVRFLIGFGEARWAVPTDEEQEKYTSFIIERNPWAKVVSKFLDDRRNMKPDALVGANEWESFNWSWMHGAVFKKNFASIPDESYKDDLEMSEGFSIPGSEHPMDDPRNAFKNENMPKDWDRYTKDNQITVDLVYKYEDLFGEDIDYKQWYYHENIDPIAGWFGNEIEAFGYTYESETITE